MQPVYPPSPRLWYDASIRNSESSRVCKPTVTRADFQELATVRLAEAKALLDGEMWDGAYYLAGYAVEVGLNSSAMFGARTAR